MQSWAKDKRAKPTTSRDMPDLASFVSLFIYLAGQLLFSSTLMQGASAFAAAHTSPIGKTYDEVLAHSEMSAMLSTGYVVEVMGLPVGFALVGQSIARLPGPERTRIYLFDRLGNTPSAHIVSLDLSTRQNQPSVLTAQYVRYVLDQAMEEYHYEWLLTLPEITFARGQPSFIFPDPKPKALSIESLGFDPKENIGEVRPISLPFFQPFGKDEGSGGTRQVFIDPLSATLVDSGKLDAVFDEDGFASAFTLELFGWLPLQFKRVPEEQLEQLVPTLPAQAVALARFTPESRLSADLKSLSQEAEKCLAENRSHELTVVKELPHAPYLLNRKSINLQNLCRGIRAVIRTFKTSKDQQKRQKVFSEKVRQVLKQHELEIPLSMRKSPHWPVIFDDAHPALWINALKELVRLGATEIADNFAIETERKRSVKLRVVLKGRSLGTVIKGVIRHRNLKLTTTVNASPQLQMSDRSWTERPWSRALAPSAVSIAAESVELDEKLEKETLHLPPFQLFNGRALLAKELGILGEVCERYGGRVGVDLGHAPHLIVKGPHLEGAWDEKTRLRLMELFLRKGALQKDCFDFIVRVPKQLAPQAKQLAETFASSVLQSDQEVQLKNAKFRHLRLMPGDYSIYVNSLVSGELLEKRDFKVENKKGRQNFTFRLEL